MRSKPELVVSAPAAVTRGATFDIAAELRFSTATPVDRITLTLCGNRRVICAHCGNLIPEPNDFLRLPIELPHEREVAPGTYPHRVTFAVPADAPCSYAGRALGFDYRVQLDVEIPWWPDARRSWTLMVLPRPSPRPPPEPTSASGATGSDQPFFEITVVDRVVGAGDVVAGALALGNLRGRGVGACNLAVVGFERSQRLGWVGKKVEVRRYNTYSDPRLIEEGGEIPFRLALPAAMPPTFSTPETRLDYELQAQAVVGDAVVVLAVPLVIGVFDRPSEATALPIHVGASRWRDAWAAAGGRCSLRLDDEALRLRGSLSGFEASVFPDLESDTFALAAELRYPPWGLGLEIRPRRLAILGAVGDDELARRCVIGGREREQVDAVIHPALRASLVAFERAHLDDDHVRVQRPVRGFEGPELAEMLAALAVLAAALRAAWTATPAPRAMAEHLDRWRAFAEETQGELSVGAMAIRGALVDGVRVDLETVFDGEEPSSTRVATRLDPPLPRGLDLESDEELAAAPPGVAALVAAIRASTSALQVDEHRIEISVAAALPDPATLRPTIAAMLSLAHKLRGGDAVGPYR